MKRTNFSNIRIRKRRHGYLARTKNALKKKYLRQEFLKIEEFYLDRIIKQDYNNPAL